MAPGASSWAECAVKLRFVWLYAAPAVPRPQAVLHCGPLPLRLREHTEYEEDFLNWLDMPSSAL